MLFPPRDIAYIVEYDKMNSDIFVKVFLLYVATTLTKMYEKK